MLCFSMLVGVLVAALIHLSGDWLFGRIFRTMTYKPYLQYGVFFALFRLYFTHIVSIYRAKRQAKTSVVLSFILFLFNLLAVLIAIYVLKSDLKGILDAQLWAFGLVAIIYTAKVFFDVSLKFQLSVILPGIWFVLPLIPHALSGWAVNYISRIFVERYMSLTDLGVFTVAMQLSLILSVINNGLNQAWVPFVFANYHKEDFVRLFSISAQRTLLLILLAASGIVLFSKELLSLMGKIEYLSAAYVLPLQVFAYIFQMLYYIFVAILIFNKRTKLLPIISITPGGAAILLNIFLIPTLGMYGAALAGVFSFLLMAGLAYYFSMRYIRVTVWSRRLSGFSLVIIFILTTVFLFVDPLHFGERMIIKGLILVGMLLFLVRLKLLNLKNLQGLFKAVN
jgi:O-antigen/teichoic acid export membrane protein